MKEQYEYLMDDYSVELIVNPDYAEKNNLHSLYLAREHLSNAYVIPCDIWCDQSPFRRHELYSWYMVSDLVDNDSSVRVNRKLELTTISASSGGNSMVASVIFSVKMPRSFRNGWKDMTKIQYILINFGRKHCTKR